jgi:hypothetical protein
MSQPSPLRATASGPKPPDTRLRGRRLTIARTAWAILLVLNFVWFGTALVAQVAAVEHPCAGDLCILTPAQAETLHRLGFGLSSYAVYFTGIPVLLVLAGSVIAAILFWRRSDDWIALVVGLFLVAYPIGNFAVISGLDAVVPPPVVLMLEVPEHLVYYGVFLIFPDGRFVPRWTWLLLVAWSVYIGASDVTSALGVQGPGWTALGYPFLYLSALGAQVYRYRHVSDVRQRQQTRWVILGFAVALLANIAFWIVLPNTVPAFQQPESLYFPVAYPIYEFITIALPVSFAIAILRSRLFDIDLIIRRTLIYGTLTALLAALYFGVVIGLQTLVGAVNSAASHSPVLIVASTLLIAALFTPLRRGLQATIDRRFYRRKYDARRTLAAFGTTLRTETDLAELSAHLVAVVQETMQPAQVSLWMALPLQDPNRQIGEPLRRREPYRQGP